MASRGLKPTTCRDQRHCVHESYALPTELIGRFYQIVKSMGRLVLLKFNGTFFYSLCHIMAVGDARLFPGFLTPVLTQLFFPKPPTTFLTCFSRGERRKYAGKKFRLNRVSTHNHQVISPTRSPLSQPGGGLNKWDNSTRSDFRYATCRNIVCVCVSSPSLNS